MDVDGAKGTTLAQKVATRVGGRNTVEERIRHDRKGVEVSQDEAAG
jgi:hypothetical protein